MAAVDSLSITLQAFDKAVNIGVAGVVSDSEALPVFNSDAVASAEISLDAFKELFAFHSDYVDVNDLDSDDVRHYIDDSKIPTEILAQISEPDDLDNYRARSAFDISRALVTENWVTKLTPNGADMDTNDLIVKKDYIRRLSQLLFNTEYGVDLFVNENALSESVGVALNAAFLDCLDDMHLISNTSLSDEHNLYGDENKKYLRRDHSGEGSTRKNICAELLKVMLKMKPSRFNNLPSLALAQVDRERIDSSVPQLYRIPFEDGDSIIIKLSLKPATTQEWFGQSTMLDSSNNVVDKADSERSYAIKITLKSNIPAPVAPVAP